MNRKDMDIVLDILKDHPMQYIGVIGMDGKPKVKPFEFKYEEDGKLWFDVMKTQQTYIELLKNPYVEITVADRETTQWIRIDGKVRFVNNTDIRKKVIASSQILKKICKNKDNKDVLPFTLDDVTIELSSLHTDMKKRIFTL
ncbi:MAG: pyridoxamine 5'-phosphate oxidase family protein [Lachnospiraceae bacterium]|nr:pyridoxamine 5'-phosphate oxidase family protein [Lachnospiraceae bacterium]